MDGVPDGDGCMGVFGATSGLTLLNNSPPEVRGDAAGHASGMGQGSTFRARANDMGMDTSGGEMVGTTNTEPRGRTGGQTLLSTSPPEVTGDAAGHTSGMGQGSTFRGTATDGGMETSGGEMVGTTTTDPCGRTDEDGKTGVVGEMRGSRHDRSFKVSEEGSEQLGGVVRAVSTVSGIQTGRRLLPSSRRWRKTRTDGSATEGSGMKFGSRGEGGVDSTCTGRGSLARSLGDANITSWLR